jgi:hypothetical protein
MAYVSCRYAPPPLTPVDQQMIVCVDEEGQEWFVPPDSQEGEWLRFKANGGEIAPYEEPA